MGRPAHYSLDIVARCRSLLEYLMPHVQAERGEDERFGGPLTTTFLLAMAGPMIALPVERIFKPADGKPVVADDRDLDPKLSEEVKKIFDGKTKFSDCPFVGGADWRFAGDVAPFNIAGWGNDKVFEHLAGDEGKAALAGATAKFMMLHLRNAIAHGGIVYLDKNGRMNDRAAAMLGFVSAKLERGTGKVLGLHISRVSEPDFRAFLLAWGDWIERSGVGDMIAFDPPIAA